MAQNYLELLMNIWKRILGWIDRLRSWLNNNEIFFKTLFLLALTVTGLCISYQTYQNSTYQTKISESQIFPIFRFSSGYNYDIEKNAITDDYLEIYNDGKAINNFEFENVNFFEGQIQCQKNYTIYEIKIPVEGYYFLNERSSNSTGFLVKMSNFGNNYHLLNLTKNFRKYFLYKSNQEMEGYFELKKYFKIKYEDLLGSPHEEYFFVDQFGGHKITTTEGAEIFNNYHEASYLERFSFNSELDELYDVWLRQHPKIL